LGVVEDPIPFRDEVVGLVFPNFVVAIGKARISVALLRSLRLRLRAGYISRAIEAQSSRWSPFYPDYPDTLHCLGRGGGARCGRWNRRRLRRLAGLRHLPFLLRMLALPLRHQLARDLDCLRMSHRLARLEAFHFHAGLAVAEHH